jgi:sulfur carrier protein
MKIILNKRKEELDRDCISVTEMLEIKKFSFRMRIIKINGVFIPRDSYSTAMIQDGDDVQMLYLMSGG